MRVLVTGATGLIGKTLCQVLVKDGHEIVVLSRHPERVQTLTGVRAHGWNPESAPPPMEAWEGVDAVIHLAGEPIVAFRWTDEHKKRVRDSRVKGTRNLVDGMKRLAVRPKVLVSCSAVGFYGNRGAEQLDERSSPGHGFLSDVCMEWEREAEAAEAAGVRVALVRVGVVLSSAGGAMEKILPSFKLGVGGRLGDGEQWFPWIHLEDIAGIFRHALLHESIVGPVNGVAPGIVNNGEFTKELAAVLNRPAILPVPEFALRLLMGEMADVVLVSQRVFPKIALDTGYRFRYPALKPALESLLK